MTPSSLKKRRSKSSWGGGSGGAVILGRESIERVEVAEKAEKEGPDRTDEEAGVEQEENITLGNHGIVL